ncbi:hypothetical protein Asp14428_36480 [Actinoplanes sp. NBRC 14428]|uniref:Uncharacterized protein n=1 Tax=Pseudosporangium ferrugineum TaxID=439699 RepID=A0A2T0S3R0_9ACTN|nr:hypothetical protein [Pseudosporangium ferrugineum]PRY28050.1 hypothetical protein CLV70_109206 [Pseudosporangium ferrugineum]BCJ52173.1 hypothetical protein Asp14428_36480 [Actinoplanes sp. NBRC 14428]
MSYPPPEGFPSPANPPTVPQPTVPQSTVPQPTVQYPPQPPAPAAPAYAPQISGTPYGAAEARRPPTVLVLAIAAAVLLVFSGLMLGLYVNERGTVGDTKASLQSTRADLTAQLNEQKTIVTQQQEKLAQAEKRANDLNTQLGTSKTKLTDVTSQRDVLVPCMRRIQDVFDSAANGDSPGISRALRQARTACDKAEIKVDS